MQVYICFFLFRNSLNALLICASTVFVEMPKVSAMSLYDIPSRLLMMNTFLHVGGRLSMASHNRASRSQRSCMSLLMSALSSI